MNDFMNKLLNNITHFVGEKPGVLPLIGVLLIILNFILSLVFAGSLHPLVTSNPLLHLGLIVALLGILSIRPLD